MSEEKEKLQNKPTMLAITIPGGILHFEGGTLQVDRSILTITDSGSIKNLRDQAIDVFPLEEGPKDE